MKMARWTTLLLIELILAAKESIGGGATIGVVIEVCKITGGLTQEDVKSVVVAHFAGSAV